MTWTDLDEMGGGSKEYAAQARQKQIDTAKLFYRVFNTDDGRKLLEFMVQKYIMSNDTPFNSENIMYESGYHAGEAGIVKMIVQQITMAEEL